MELVLSATATPAEFEAFKTQLLTLAIENKACKEGIEAHNSVATPQEWLDECGKYLGWLGGHGIAPILEGFTHCGGVLYLSKYPHALPSGFTHCGGGLCLSNYHHPLPAGFTFKGEIFK